MSGAAAFGMLYLPVPVVSVYAKAGLARLQATSNVSLFLPGDVAGGNPGLASLGATWTF